MGAFTRACASVSASAPPEARSGLLTAVTPSGLSASTVSWPARTLPAKPMPQRYSAVMLPCPVGRRAPCLPSPNITLVASLASRRVR